MLTQWKNPFVRTASRIGASWLLAIGILIGAQGVISLMAYAHPDAGPDQMMTRPDAAPKFVTLHNAEDGKPIYVNLSYVTSINQQELDGKMRTLVWFGSGAMQVTETPDQVLSMIQGQGVKAGK